MMKSIGRKRILVGFLIMLALMCLCYVVCAAESGTCGPNLSWTLDDAGLLTISGTGEMTSHPWSNAALRTVEIKDGVTSVTEAAFKDAMNLGSVSIPDSVTVIGKSVFWGCDSLKEISLPKHITSINNYCFFSCDNLLSIVIPEGVTYIGFRTFSCCGKLSSVKLPNSITDIDSEAFYLCPFEEITIPNGLTKINDGLFGYCTKLKEITIPSGIVSIGNSAFDSCWSLSKVTISDSLKEIGLKAFINSGVKRITIPNSVTYVGLEAFNKNTIIFCNAGSYIEQWAKDNDCIPHPSHVEEVDAAVEATCTETGLTEGKHCSICGDILIAQEVVPALGHHEVVDPAVAATCTATGLSEGKHCDRCGLIITPQKVIPELGHVEVTDPEVAPTYTTTGLSEGKHCSRCGAVLVAQEVIPMLPSPSVPTIALSETDLSFKGVQTKTVTASLSDESDSIASVSSDKKKVAKVKFSGNTISISSAKQAGKATITVTTAKGATAQINVTVKEGIALNEKKITLKKDKTFKIKILAIPSTVKAKEFKSDKPAVVTVDKKGVVKAVGKGKATITVTLSNKKTLKLKVTVK